MAEIQLHGKRGTGKVALVDDQDAELLNAHSWHVSRDGYTRTQLRDTPGRRPVIAMHHLLFDEQGQGYRDHINGDPLDNRRANLRPCTKAENNRNRGSHKTSKTGIKGVSPWRGRFRVVIHDGKKQIYLGSFPTADLAAAAYNGAAIVLYGAFARLNVIPTEQAVQRAD